MSEIFTEPPAVSPDLRCAHCRPEPSAVTAETQEQATPGTPDQAAIAAHLAHRNDITTLGRALRSWRTLSPEQRDKWRAHATAEPDCTVCTLGDSTVADPEPEPEPW